MTIATLANRQSYVGNGVTTIFSFNNKFLIDADLVVLVVTDTTGDEALQVLTTDYTVTGAGVPGGGAVTMIVPPATGETLVIFRDPEKTQGVDLVEGDPLPVDASVETPLDKLTMLIQRICDTLGRTLHLKDGDPTDTTNFFLPTLVDRANSFLAFDENGIPKVNSDIPKFIVGTGVPSPSLGNDGDMYIDSLTGDLYGPKTAGAWGSPVANLIAPAQVNDVFGRQGNIVALAGDYLASQVTNDSGVVGAFVSDALDTLSAAIGAIVHPVASVFGRVGAVIATAGDYLSSQVTNDSGVVGAFVSDALNTLNSPFIAFLNVTQSWTRAQRQPFLVLTDAATIAVDFDLANNFFVTITADRTIGAPSNVVSGQTGYLVIKQDGSGGHIPSFNVIWDFGIDGPPDVITTAGSKAFLGYVVDDDLSIIIKFIGDF